MSLYLGCRLRASMQPVPQIQQPPDPKLRRHERYLPKKKLDLVPRPILSTKKHAIACEACLVVSAVIQLLYIRQLLPRLHPYPLPRLTGSCSS